MAEQFSFFGFELVKREDSRCPAGLRSLESAVEKAVSMLYLLKSSRVNEYHHQNVAIIGAPEGARFEITYGARWIPEGLVVNAGDGCVIVFADSPYQHFVPARFGVIEEVRLDEGRLILDVRVTSYVRAGGTARLEALWSRIDRDDPERPGKKFLIESENPDLLAPRSHSEMEEAWSEIIDQLGPDGFFARSTFARTVAIMDADGRPIDQGRRLSIGEVVTSEVVIRTPSTEVEKVVVYAEGESADLVEVVESGPFDPSGVIRVPLRILRSGPLAVTLRFLPEPLKSTRLDLTFDVAETLLPPVVAAAPDLPASDGTRTIEEERADVRRLVRFLQREVDMSSETWLRLCEDVLLPTAPTEPSVLAACGDAAFRLGEFQRCVDHLKRITTRRENEDAQLEFAAIRSGANIDHDELLSRIDLAREDRFRGLLTALEHAERSSLEIVVDALMPGDPGDAKRGVLGDERFVTMAQVVFPRLMSMSLMMKLAREIAYREPDLGARLLLQKWPAANAPEEAVDALLDWEVGGSDLLPYFDRRLATISADKQWVEIDPLVSKARRVLRGAELGAFIRRIGEILVESGDATAADEGFDLLCEGINLEVSLGNFDLAERHCRALLGHSVVAGDDARRDAAQSLLELSMQSIFETEEFQVWQRFQEASQVTTLLPWTSGRALHLVGGKSFGWLQELEAELKLASARWHETEKNKGINTDWVDALDGDRDVVIVITEFIGHAISIPVKEKCTRKKVPHLESKPTKRAVLDSLVSHFANSC